MNKKILLVREVAEERSTVSGRRIVELMAEASKDKNYR